jgi:iron complex transport system permease protein
VSSGAVLFAVVTIAAGQEIFGGSLGPFMVYTLPLAAFIGGLLVTFLLVMLSTRSGHLAVATLLLCGVAVAAIAGSLTGLVMYLSDDRALRDVTLWTLGSLSGASWTKILAALPLALLALAVVPRLSRGLNGFLLGETEALHLGVDIERIKRLTIVSTALCVGFAVAVAGLIGFVGLIVPHLVRLLAGSDHRWVLPLSALAGAALVIGADIVARTIIAPAELPIGIVMAAIGGPLFLHLVMRNRSAWIG